MSHRRFEPVRGSRWAALCFSLVTCGCFQILSASLEFSARALEWQKGDGFRSATVPLPASGKTGFTLLPESVTSIAFTNYLSDASAAENQIRLNGSGVALGDVDGDGW